MSLRVAPLVRTAARRQTQVNLRAPALRRHFAEGPKVNPPPPPGKSNIPLYLAGVGALAAGAAYLFYGTEGTPRDTAKELGSKARGLAAAAEGKAGLRHSQADYQKVYDRIAEVMEKEDYDDGSLAPVLIRLAWHCSGTYDKNDKTGGSNYATMRFKPESEHGANNGLNIAREHMEKIKKEFPWISYGDLWTLGGVAAIQESGGPVIPWRPGRIDGFEVNQTPDGRLPDAAQGSKHLRDIFYRMGFNDREIVALAGAHALGRCHTDRSGFEGPWTFSPTSMSSAFYDLLLNEKWQLKKWKGPAQYEDVKTKSLMMLPTDMSLVTDPKFKPVVQEYAKDEDAFFRDFSKAFATLLELGVPEENWKTKEPWNMESV